MGFFSSPKSIRLASGDNGSSSIVGRSLTEVVTFGVLEARKAKNHDAHPSLNHLILLVFEAVLEVVCVSLPGYIVARQGMFDADKQKFVANLNVALFTPCLIFTKLASQLTADKLLELAVIPVIFVVQTFVSYIVSKIVSKVFGFGKRPANFVTAMGVFGNSNSLPISLVISLSQTLNGLHWDKIPGDNDDEVAARGILYLLIFQQLGQLVRWSWGYHVLLAPPESYEDQQAAEAIEEGRYRDDPGTDELIPGLSGEGSSDASGHDQDEDDGEESYEPGNGNGTLTATSSATFDSGGRTPITNAYYVEPEETEDQHDPRKVPELLTDRPNGGVPPPDESNGDITSFPRIRSTHEEEEIPDGIRGLVPRAQLYALQVWSTSKERINTSARDAFDALPNPVQTGLKTFYRILSRFLVGLWEFMNPPLWAMFFAIIVASIPSLQRLFFEEGSFIANSVTRAVSQSGGVAVPLILVVLGANLARNTLPREAHNSEEKNIETKLLVASLISRMLLPTLIMAPILALVAKYVPVSIVDDPIFVVVCFLLTGAPSALQLAQICQINGVYEGVMSKLLFQSYVIWILPSTLILVMCALEVLEWANPIN